MVQPIVMIMQKPSTWMVMAMSVSQAAAGAKTGTSTASPLVCVLKRLVCTAGGWRAWLAGKIDNRRLKSLVAL